MPNIEIDEVELQNLKRLQGVASKVMQHPEGAKLLEKAVKMVEPTALTPNLDREAAFQEPVKKVLDEVESLKKQLADEKAENEKNAKLAKLAEQERSGLAQLRASGYTDEGIEGVKKLMDEKGITDPLDAAAIFEKQHPQPAPVESKGFGAWGFTDNVRDDDKFVKNLLETKGGIDAVVDREAMQALNEFRGQSRR